MFNSIKTALSQIPKKIWTFLLVLTVFRLIYIYFLPLTPQEAYYWYYSQYPALSYFDHPPLSAYSIWLGTALFGNNPFGVKFMAVMWGLLTNIFLLLTIADTLKLNAPVSREQKDRYLWLTTVFFNLTIFAHLYSLLNVPDNSLMLCWILSMYFFQKILIDGKRRWWFLSGIFIGIGFLGKYTIVALLPAYFFIIILKKEHRHWLMTPYPYLAVITAAMAFSPVIIWNYLNDWASFRFQFSGRAAEAKSLRFNYLGQLVASQLFMLTPMMFFLLINTIIRFFKQRATQTATLFHFLSGLFLIGGFSLISLTSLIKMNWLLPGYFGFIILIVFMVKQDFQFTGFWPKTGFISSIVLIIIAHLLQILPNIPLSEGNTWSGWQDTAQKVYNIQQEQGGRDRCFIFANSYKSASLLKFYLPDQQDAYAENVYHRPALQFDIWGLRDDLDGKNALYIFTDRREYKNDLQYIEPFFEKVEPLIEFEYTFFTGQHVRTIFCYFCTNYKHGRSP